MIRRGSWVMMLIVLCSLAAWAGKPATVVDSGTFGVYANGTRVASETFKVEARDDESVISSELRMEAAGSKTVQSSEMDLAPNGDLRSYTWKDSGEGKPEAVVAPREGFLQETLKYDDGAHTQEVPHMVPPSTAILDDNFYIHHEILLWRYLTTCTTEKQQRQCKPAQFGVLIPHQHISAMVKISLIGSETLPVKGTPTLLNKLKFETEGTEWYVWSDANSKVVRISIPANHLEVVRD